MRKSTSRLLIATSLTLSFISSFCQYPLLVVYSDSLNTFNISPNSTEVVKRNKIKSTLIFRYNISNNRFTDYFLFKTIYYDTSCKQIKQEMLNRDGAVGYTDSFIYNNTGSLLKSIFYNSDGKVWEEHNYESGVDKQYSIDGTVRIDSGTNWFNSKGQLTKYSYLDDKEGFSYIYHYNDEGKPARIERYDVNGKKIEADIYEYSNNRKNSELIIYKEDVKGKRKTVMCTYNSLKQCTRCIHYYNPPLTETFIYYKDGTLFEYKSDYGNYNGRMERFFYTTY